MNDKTTPRNRDESEIAGYRDALNVVHESFEYIPLTPNYILQLHKIMFSHTDSAFGGSFKNVQNYISATDATGKSFTLFTPLAPYETAPAMQEICDAYNRAVGESKVDPLILIPVFIHDFLCVHPFLDGNGRMSRLLTTLLLYRAGYEVGKYISLEAKISKIRVHITMLLNCPRAVGMRNRMIPLISSNTCWARSSAHIGILKIEWKSLPLLPKILSEEQLKARLANSQSAKSWSFART